MRFEDIQGNAPLLEALRSMVDRGRIPHAMLLHEDDGGGAFPIILAFLQYLYCTDHTGCGTCPSCNKVAKLIHPDIHFVYPVASARTSSDSTVSPSLPYLPQWRELLLTNPSFTEEAFNEALGIEQKSTVITVAEAASVLSRLSLSAVEGGYRTVVMYLPEKMNAAAANKLLKMIEEPPEKTLFLLVTHSPEKVLVTIFSRCLFLRVTPSGKRLDADPALREIFFDLMTGLAARDLGAALESADAIVALPSREKQKSMIAVMAEGCRNIFLLQQGLRDLAVFPGEDQAFYQEMAVRCKRTFARNALSVLDRSLLLLERNVSQKILFTDLTCKLLRII
jgi:DNA polymerase-3 subunit delta'